MFEIEKTSKMKDLRPSGRKWNLSVPVEGRAPSREQEEGN